jgi:hypothetical protein
VTRGRARRQELRTNDDLQRKQELLELDAGRWRRILRRAYPETDGVKNNIHPSGRTDDAVDGLRHLTFISRIHPLPRRVELLAESLEGLFIATRHIDPRTLRGELTRHGRTDGSGGGENERRLFL